MVLDVSESIGDRVDGGRASRWKLSVFEHQDRRRYKRHFHVLDEVSFPSDSVEASLRRRFCRIWLYDPEQSQPSVKTRRLHFVCRKS
jgi:hypothetical protein